MKNSNVRDSRGVRVVIFDLDGTLVNAYEAIVRSMNFTLQTLGYPQAEPWRICRAVGWGDTRLVSAFIKEKDITKALRIYRSHHRDSLKKYSKLLPFAKRLLHYLKRHGFKIAIASNRPTAFTAIIVKQLKIREFFDYILCADKLPRGKPDPGIIVTIMKRLKAKNSETLFVGDMTVDIQTARNAKVKAIAVTTGSSTASEIKKARPFKIIKNLASLKKLL